MTPMEADAARTHAREPGEGSEAPEALRLDVTWESPLFDLSGYAAVARSMILALSAEGLRVRAHPMWGGLDVIDER